MRNVLFSYNRRVTNEKGEEVMNTNFINPLSVISFYWQENADKKKVLSVFLGNGYTVTFVESIGNRFVQHMEDFLRYLLLSGITQTASTVPQEYNRREKKGARNPITAEVVDEDIPQGTSAEWASN